MLSGKNKLKIITILDSALGVGSSLKGNEQAHYCPFCNHHKKKLQVNLDNQRWHCWVCDSKGRSITSLLRKLNVDLRDISVVNDGYGDEPEYDSKEEYVAKLQLPKEFKQLYFCPKSINPAYNQALHYLNKRGITKADIVKYNIGYCKEGLYAQRVIIPSYNSDGSLNYFVSRSYYPENKMKYKNPPISKNIICFESQVNWKEPIILCEGVFDAFFLPNPIPMLGKMLSDNLFNTLYEKVEGYIHICLDGDAWENALRVYHNLNGGKLYNKIKILKLPKDKDVCDLRGNIEEYYYEIK